MFTNINRRYSICAIAYHYHLSGGTPIIGKVNELPVGRRLRLLRIDGGQGLRRRLLALGLSIGDEVDLIQRRAGGVVLARGNNRVALGEGVSQKLLAEVVD